MVEFIEVNRGKLVAPLVVSSVVFSVFVSLIFAYAFWTGSLPNISLILWVYAWSAIGMPMFLLLIITLRGTWDIYKRKKAFSSAPYVDLLKHGFALVPANRDRKWEFVETVMIGYLNDFAVFATVDSQFKPNELKFMVLYTERKLNLETMVTKPFTKEAWKNISAEQKSYSVKRPEFKTAKELLNDLNELGETAKLKRKNYRQHLLSK